jgi:lipopolysaccharide heptosyltransferase II
MRPELLKQIDRLVGGMLVSLCPSLSPPAGPSRAPHTILLIRPGGIGDAVLLVPVIRVLGQQFPDAAIDILAERRNAGVFPLCPGIRSLYRYDVPAEFFGLLRCRYDVVIDTEQWHRLSAVVARLIRSPVKVGFATNERRRLFTHAVDYSHDRYEADSFFDLLVPFDIPLPPMVTVPFLKVPASAVENVDKRLSGVRGRRYVVIFPGASIPERRWGSERYREVAAGMVAAGMAIVVVGAAGDSDDAAAIVSTVPGSLNLAGQTSLAETAALIQGAALLVSGDSGLLHLAVGLGIPTVSLFGPGIARKWAPRGVGHRVINIGLPCSPCTRFGTTPSCPRRVRCLADIAPAEVLSAVMELLETEEKPLDFSSTD